MAIMARQTMRAVGLRWRGMRLLILLALLPLASCKTPKFLCFKSSGLGAIAITSTETVNRGRPIDIALVFITDKEVLQSISKMKAKDYFAMQEQIERDFPKGYQFQHWQIQAGQYETVVPTGAPCNLVGTFLFVNYRFDGDFRQKVGKEKSGTLVLGDKNFTWVPKG